jgi:putative ABC transport system permease protein
MQTLTQAMTSSIAQPRLRTYVLAAFAGVALLLAVVGLYGLVSHSVSQRAGELALRHALGATAGDVARIVLGEGARVTLAGGALGAVGALASGRLISSMLYGVGAFDAVTYAAAGAILVAAVAVACCVPARRAARIDPMTTLRTE